MLLIEIGGGLLEEGASLRREKCSTLSGAGALGKNVWWELKAALGMSPAWLCYTRSELAAS